MPKAKFFTVLIFAFLFLAACSGESPSSETTSEPAFVQNKEMIKDADDDGGGGGQEEGKGSGRGSGTGNDQTVAQNQVSLEKADQSKTETVSEKPLERKIIRNADLSLESDAPEEAQQKITAIAESKGGFVVESNQSSSDIKAVKRDTVVMTIRIPAEKFNESLDEIRQAGGGRVIQEIVKGQDVTEQFIDIEARLKTQKALEAQFLEIMKQSKSVQDALNVQRELANVRTEIEKIEGRKRFLEDQSSLSTIKVTLRTPRAIAGSSKGFFYRLTEAVGTGLDGALSFVFIFVTFIIAIVPFLFLVVLPIYLLLRYFWRKYRKRRLAREMVAEETGRQEDKETSRQGDREINDQ